MFESYFYNTQNVKRNYDPRHCSSFFYIKDRCSSVTDILLVLQFFRSPPHLFNVWKTGLLNTNSKLESWFHLLVTVYKIGENLGQKCGKFTLIVIDDGILNTITMYSDYFYLYGIFDILR